MDTWTWQGWLALTLLAVMVVLALLDEQRRRADPVRRWGQGQWTWQAGVALAWLAVVGVLAWWFDVGWGEAKGRAGQRVAGKRRGNPPPWYPPAAPARKPAAVVPAGSAGRGRPDPRPSFLPEHMNKCQRI